MYNFIYTSYYLFQYTYMYTRDDSYMYIYIHVHVYNFIYLVTTCFNIHVHVQRDRHYADMRKILTCCFLCGDKEWDSFWSITPSNVKSGVSLKQVYNTQYNKKYTVIHMYLNENTSQSHTWASPTCTSHVPYVCTCTHSVCISIF